MNRGILLKRTVNNISLLPDWRLQEVSDYVDFLIKTFDDNEITEGIMKLASESKSFDFLNDEEEIYNESDIIEKFLWKKEILS